MIDTIKTFIAVATYGSFTAVARHQDIAVSSVARKIDGLEAELGAKLFARSSKSIILTDAGEQFLPRARSIVSELEEAKLSLADLHADPRGQLSITAPASFGRRHVVPAIASFLQLYPFIEIELHLSDQRVDLLTQRVDIAIRLGTLPDSDFVATRLAPIHRLTCASPAYVERHGRPATPEQLVEHNCLTYASTPVPSGWWCYAGVNREAALPVHGSLRTDDTDAMLAAAVAGVGIVHLASWLVNDLIQADKLISLFPNIAAPAKSSQAAVHAVRMPGRSHTAKAQLFITHLKNCFGDPPYWDRL